MVNSVSSNYYNPYQGYNNYSYINSYQYPTELYDYSADAYVSSSGETCTDGKDDGKIGFFEKIGNAVKGVGKGIVNGIKGMFTGKDGKFSLGKTLLSIGTIALCVAVPAVGVAACCVGAVAGGAQVVKGAVRASQATTDAEAKEAWQDMGSGTFQVAASVVGAKAGIKAVKSTSTATNGLASLGKNATTGQKAAALGRDMISSTKNQVANIRANAPAYLSSAKTKLTNLKDKAIGKYKSVKSKATPYYEAAKYKYEQSVVKNANTKNMSASQAARIDKYTTHMAEAYENPDIMNIVGQMDDFAGTAGKYYGKAKTTAGNAIKHPIQTGKQLWTAAKGKVTKANGEALWNSTKQTIQTGAAKVKGFNLRGRYQTIMSELQNGSSSYAQVVQKYGFDNVAQVLQYVGGTAFGTDLI